MENYIENDNTNVTLTLIDGTVTFETELNDEVIKLSQGDYIKVPTEVFHKITTISSRPSCFMYTYVNEAAASTPKHHQTKHSPIPIIEDATEHYNSLKQFFVNIANGFVSIVYDVPMTRRKNKK